MVDFKYNKAKQKDELLTYLSSTLPFFNKTKKHEQNPPSLLFVKIAFRLGQINPAKIMESDYDLTYNKSKKFGESSGAVVWKFQGEVRKNKELLEKPNSLNEYQSAFPSCLSGFFNGLINILQKKNMM